MKKKTKRNSIIIVLLLLFFGASAEKTESHEASYENGDDSICEDNQKEWAKNAIDFNEAILLMEQTKDFDERMLIAVEAFAERNTLSNQLILCLVFHERTHHK